MEIYLKTNDLNKWIAKYFTNKDLITVDDLINCIEELDGEVSDLKIKIEELETDIEENYKRIPTSTQVGVSDKDFV